MTGAGDNMQKSEIIEAMNQQSIFIGEEGRRIFSQPLLTNLVSEEPLVVIHPGWKNYGSKEKDIIDYMNSFKGYDSYIGSLMAEIEKHLQKGIAFIFYDKEKKNGFSYTKKLVNLKSDKIVWVPSRSTLSFEEDDFDVGFFKDVREHTGKIKIAGEWRKGCVRNYYASLKEIFDVLPLEELIFPTKR